MRNVPEVVALRHGIVRTGATTLELPDLVVERSLRYAKFRGSRSHEFDCLVNPDVSIE